MLRTMRQEPARLLRGPNEQDCIACHSGGSNISPAPPQCVLPNLAKVGHPIPQRATTCTTPPKPCCSTTTATPPAPIATTATRPVQVTTFPPPPAIRASQNGVAGISATDGVTIAEPSRQSVRKLPALPRHQFGESGQSDLRISAGARGLGRRSAEPDSAVRLNRHFQPSRDARPQQPAAAAQPADQHAESGRHARRDAPWARRFFCTDCHNSDDNREFGGTGPNGPHGSKWTHILERQYELSQAPGPGQLITNLFPNPDLSVNGPYALCGKCHDLNNRRHERQLEPARLSHQHRLLLLGVPHRPRHGRQQRHHLRRAAGELRHQRRGTEWGHADLLQPRHQHLRAGLPRGRAQRRRLRYHHGPRQ